SRLRVPRRERCADPAARQPGGPPRDGAAGPPDPHARGPAGGPHALSAPRRSVAAAGALVGAPALAFALYARCTAPAHLLGSVALVPWLVVVDHTTSLLDAVAVGLAMCVVFVLGFFGWLPGSIQSYTGASWPLCALVLVLMAPVIQFQLVVFAGVRHVVRRC